MKIKVGQLKEIIRKVHGGSDPNEAFDKSLVDDPAMDKDSKYVSRERKKKIKNFLGDLGIAK